MATVPKQTVIPGIILIILGLGLFGLIRADQYQSEIIPVLLGGILVVIYFFKKSYLFLLPGCLLLGLGLGGVIDPNVTDTLNMRALGIGIGFLGVFFIHRAYAGKVHRWPLIPGILFIADGVSVILREVLNFLGAGWPLILVIIGIVIIYRGMMRSRV
jgi:hypothetical protein